MKYNFYFIFLLYLFLFPNGSLAQDSWIKFESDDVLSFVVDVPAEMEKTIKKIPTAVGELNAITYAYQGNAEDPNYLYLINFVKYPEETFPLDSVDLIEAYLQNAVLVCAERVHGEVVYSSDLEEANGKLFRVKYNEGNAVIKGKAYIRDDVFISLQVFTVQSKSLNQEMDYFLDSFKVK
jgi:hypothetical protein